jgi:hypothetical protein
MPVGTAMMVCHIWSDTGSVSIWPATGQFRCMPATTSSTSEPPGEKLFEKAGHVVVPTAPFPAPFGPPPPWSNCEELPAFLTLPLAGDDQRSVNPTAPVCRESA